MIVMIAIRTLKRQFFMLPASYRYVIEKVRCRLPPYYLTGYKLELVRKIVISSLQVYNTIYLCSCQHFFVKNMRFLYIFVVCIL